MAVAMAIMAILAVLVYGWMASGGGANPRGWTSGKRDEGEIRICLYLNKKISAVQTAEPKNNNLCWAIVLAVYINRDKIQFRAYFKQRQQKKTAALELACN